MFANRYCNKRSVIRSVFLKFPGTKRTNRPNFQVSAIFFISQLNYFLFLKSLRLLKNFLQVLLVVSVELDFHTRCYTRNDEISKKKVIRINNLYNNKKLQNPQDIRKKKKKKKQYRKFTIQLIPLTGTNTNFNILLNTTGSRLF